MTTQTVTPVLVVIAPSGLSGRVLALNETETVVGRAPGSDVVLDDPQVSRAHAALRYRDGAMMLEDIGSSAGTTVNAQPVIGAIPLRHGDVIAFGSVVARFEVAPSGTQTGAHFAVGAQQAHQLNNVGGDQYLHYITHLQQERESFLRAIAATKTKARRLCWVGFLLFVAGAATYGFTLLAWIAEQQGPSLDEPVNADVFGRAVGGVPIGLIGFGIAFVGQVLLILGIVLHIVAAARRRRLDTTATPAPPFLYGSS